MIDYEQCAKHNIKELSHCTVGLLHPGKLLHSVCAILVLGPLFVLRYQYGFLLRNIHFRGVLDRMSIITTSEASSNICLVFQCTGSGALCGRLGAGAVGRVRVWCTDEVRRGPARGIGCQSHVVRTGRACRFTHGRHTSRR
jgi:hypothetical protein